MIDVEVVRSVIAVIQWIVLACSVGILAMCLGLGYTVRSARPYLILPGTLAVHSIVFYAFALAGVLGSPWGNLWSAVLRLHSYIMILGTLVVVALALHGDEDEAADD